MSDVDIDGALRELEVIAVRASALERVPYHADPHYAYQELRGIGRLLGSLAGKMKVLFEAQRAKEPTDGT